MFSKIKSVLGFFKIPILLGQWIYQKANKIGCFQGRSASIIMMKFLLLHDTEGTVLYLSTMIAYNTLIYKVLSEPELLYVADKEINLNNFQFSLLFLNIFTAFMCFI